MSVCKYFGREYWTQRWAKDIIPFHRASLHPYLKEIGHHFTSVGKQLRVFFPLCGKMQEMKWFYDHGHEVVGVEIAEKAIRNFFNENNLQIIETYSSSNECTVFQTPNGQLSVYCTDIFAFLSSQPPLMDVVWDRASLCIMASQEERRRYVKLVRSVLAPGGMYILTTFKHNNDNHSGPPYNVNDSDVMELFGAAWHPNDFDALHVATCPNEHLLCGDDAKLTKESELVNDITVTGISQLYEVTWCMHG